MNFVPPLRVPDWPEVSGSAGRGPAVDIVSLAELKHCRRWTDTLANERKDHRYFEIVEETIHPEFEYRYFVVKDQDGRIRAVQPFFILALDILVGVSPRIGPALDFIRRLWPNFMKVRTLMVGSAAGEGHLDGEDELSWHKSAQRLSESIVQHAREAGTRLIVLKEFHARYRAAMEPFRHKGFTRVPSMPMVRLDIDYENFEGYMRGALNSSKRKKLRNKLKASANAGLEMSEVSDIRNVIDDAFPLYMRVYERSSLRFEKLTKEYFCAMGRQMPDKARFFVWRQNGKIVAFASALVNGDVFFGEYLGFDYSVAIELHLYHRVFHDLVSWSIAHGYKHYDSSGLNYDPKYQLGFLLDPIDLYARHTSPVANFILKWALRWLEPTRYDKTLPRFSNYKDLWGADDEGAPPSTVAGTPQPQLHPVGKARSAAFGA
jgi:hypothetical protein